MDALRALFIPLLRRGLVDEDVIRKLRIAFAALANARVDGREEAMKHFSVIAEAVEAVEIYVRMMGDERLCEEARALETEQFKLIFTVERYHYESVIYPVYKLHDAFVFEQEPCLSFKSSTGSGKTGCAPFLFAIRGWIERLDKPFFIMTQPGKAIVQEKGADLGPKMDRWVEFVTTSKKMLEFYKAPETIAKPVIGILSSFELLALLAEAKSCGIDIFKNARFCLDEAHERPSSPTS
jgi:hypothetical protein